MNQQNATDNEAPRRTRRTGLGLRWLLLPGVGLVALIGAVLALMLFCDAIPSSLHRYLLFATQRRVDHVEKFQNVVDCLLTGLDLRPSADLIPTLRFNLHTRWPSAQLMPANVNPGQLLTNAMSPGLGVRELHRQGITGKGVNVAIIDYRLFPDHPEFSRQLAAIHELSGQRQGSVHGPAVASLLVGAQCGTAPGARLYFVATSDPGKGVDEHISALDWILATNTRLAQTQKIRVISISSCPDGDRAQSERSVRLWAAARDRAEQAGIMVLDCSRAAAFIGPCELDPLALEDPARCRPVLAQGRPDFFAGHLLAPMVPRAVAEQRFDGLPGYQYCGNLRETYFYHGVSWAVPYCAGVLALGWQLRPDLTPAQIRELLFRSAHVLPTGEKIINPPEFIRQVRETPATTPAERQL
jgi:serine protease AprX